MKRIKFYLWLNWFRANNLYNTIKYRMIKDTMPFRSVLWWSKYDYLDTVVWCQYTDKNVPDRLIKKWSHAWDQINSK